MTNYGAFLVIAIIIAAIFIGLSLSQGQTNSIIITQNVTNTIGVTIPADNVTAGTFPDTYDYPNNVTFTNITVSNYTCLNTGCTKFITTNATHIIINNTG